MNNIIQKINEAVKAEASKGKIKVEVMMEKLNSEELKNDMFTNTLKKYSSVDTRFGTDKITTHSYGEIYDSLFFNYKDKNINLLEIGFDGGFSLQAYHDYFSRGNIYGIDITDNMSDSVRLNNELKIIIGDAKKPEIVSMCSSICFDIIIEDASHLLEDQIQHFSDYVKSIKPGGIYIIEDVNGSNLEKIAKETEKIADMNDLAMKIYDLRSVKNRFDDILIVFFKN